MFQANQNNIIIQPVFVAGLIAVRDAQETGHLVGEEINPHHRHQEHDKDAEYQVNGILHRFPALPDPLDHGYQDEKEDQGCKPKTDEK
jgi:hypothetical protein